MSKSAERVYALLVDANPIPDTSELQPAPVRRPHLRVIDSRRDDMQTQTRPDIAPAPRPRPPLHRRRWIPALIGAAAVVVAIIATILFLGSNNTDSPPVITQPTSTVPLGAAGLPVADQEALAREMIADWNAGDLDAVLAPLGDDGNVYELEASDPAVRLDLAFYMGLGQEAVVQDCGPLELQPGFDSGRFSCSTTTTDDVSGPLGITAEVDWQLRFSNGELRALEFYVTSEPPNIFSVVEEMATWIESAHPEIWAATFATGQRCNDFNCYDGNWASSPEAAAEMLRLAPEFRAQTDY